MKNLLWATLAMVMCLFAACSDDDDDKTPQGPVITYAGKLPSKVGNYIFEYDDNNRCVKVRYNSDELGEIDYDKGLLISDGEEQAKVSFTGKGYIKSIKSSWDYKDEEGSYKGNGEISFSYKNDQLVSYSEEYNENSKEYGESYSIKGTYKVTYTWKNGNLVQVDSEGSEIENGEKSKERSTYTIEYGEQKNELGQFTMTQSEVFDMEDADIFGLVGMLGKASAYFPISYTEEWYEESFDESDRDGKSTVNTTYSFNQDGTIRTERMNSYSSYTYSYITVDGEELSGRSSQLENDGKKWNFRSFFMRHGDRK